MLKILVVLLIYSVPSVSFGAAGNNVISNVELNQSCEFNGSVKVAFNGKIYSCQSNLWVAAASGVPAGAIQAFNLSSCPLGWVAANGLNGTPDLRNMFVRGMGGGRALGSYQADELKSHSHSYVAMVYNNSIDGVDSTVFPSFENNYGVRQTNATGGLETRPKNIALLYCQKT